jgi:hypothetical protein
MLHNFIAMKNRTKYIPFFISAVLFTAICILDKFYSINEIIFSIVLIIMSLSLVYAAILEKRTQKPNRKKRAIAFIGLAIVFLSYNFFRLIQYYL